MTCQRAEELVVENVLGVLDEADTRELSMHLSTCLSCLALKESYAGVDRAVRRMEAAAWSPAARAAFESRVLLTLENQRGERRRPVHPVRGWVWGAGLAAAAALALTLWPGGRREPGLEEKQIVENLELYRHLDLSRDFASISQLARAAMSESPEAMDAESQTEGSEQVE